VEARQTLAQVEFFTALAPEALSRLEQASSQRRLRRGDLLFLEGDPVTHLFVVERGWVKVFKSHPEGRRQLVLHLEGPGSPLAEVAVFLEQARYPASAEAVAPAEVIALPKDVFLALMDDTPALARAVIRYLARRQRRLIGLLTQVAFQDVFERLVGYLLKRLEREGQGFVLPTNTELAAMLGTVPELVSRKLWQLYREGMIRLDDRRVYIPSPGYLKVKFKLPAQSEDA